MTQASNDKVRTDELLLQFERELRVLKWNELRRRGQDQDTAIRGVNEYIDDLRGRATKEQP